MASKQMQMPGKISKKAEFSTKPINSLKSALFVKKLIATSISNILYLRALMPEEAFMDREMDGVPVKILYEKSGCAAAQQIIDWLKGAFEALDKKYAYEKMDGARTFAWWHGQRWGSAYGTIVFHRSQSDDNEKVLLFDDPSQTCFGVDVLIDERTLPFRKKALLQLDSIDDNVHEPTMEATQTLKQLEFIFFVEEENKQVILESYMFTFTYGDDKVEVKLGTAQMGETTKQFEADEIRMANMQLLRHTSTLMQNLRKMTEKVCMRVRVYYYEEVTPEDYEPPGFQRQSSVYTFEDENTKFNHGQVDTGFHTLKLSSRIGTSRIKPNCTRREDEANSAGDGRGWQSEVATACSQLPPSSQRSASSTFTVDNRSEMFTKEDESNVVSIAHEPHYSQSVACSSIRETPTDVQNASVHCACAVAVDEGLLVFCELCRRWNHAVCYRFLDENSIPPYFCCIYCHDPSSNAQCNDSSLIHLSEDDRKAICVYRRALAFCLSTWRVDERTLASELSVSPQTAEDVFARMEADGVFVARKKRGKGSYKHINTAYLKDVIIPAYFEKAVIQFSNVVDPTVCIDSIDKNEENEDLGKMKTRKLKASS